MEKSRRKLNCCLESCFHIFDFQGRLLSSEPVRASEKKEGKIVKFIMNIFICQMSKIIMYGLHFVILGILIYIYAFDHNPPHIHVRSGTDNFSITIEDRIIEGVA